MAPHVRFGSFSPWELFTDFFFLIFRSAGRRLGHCRWGPPLKPKKKTHEKKPDNEVESLSWNVNFEEATTDAARCGVWRIFVFEKYQ